MNCLLGLKKRGHKMAEIWEWFAHGLYIKYVHILYFYKNERMKFISHIVFLPNTFCFENTFWNFRTVLPKVQILHGKYFAIFCNIFHKFQKLFPISSYSHIRQLQFATQAFSQKYHSKLSRYIYVNACNILKLPHNYICAINLFTQILYTTIF